MRRFIPSMFQTDDGNEGDLCPSETWLDCKAVIEAWVAAGNPQRMLTPEEAAAFLNLSTRSVYRAIETRSLPIAVTRINSSPRLGWFAVARLSAHGRGDK